MASVHEVFNMIKDKLTANPAKVANLKATYQFEIIGPDGGTYHAVFDNGAYDIAEGPIANPGCVVTMATADFLSMVEGKLNPTAAFMGGKLKLKGDMGMAMKLQSVLS